MTPPALISVTNKSARVSDADVEAMVAAVAKQVVRDVGPIYGLVPAIEFVRSGGHATPGGSPCVISDVPDVDGALGYHAESDDGVPFIHIFAGPVIDNGGSALKGALSVSAVLSHEVLELLGDSPVNKWVDGPDGRDYAFELCDPVQADCYEIDGCSVSNFVYPAFFDPRAQAGSRFDHLGKLGAPFTIAKGGYQTVRTEPGKETNVFGAIAASRRVHVVFGPEFPEWRRPATVEKVRRRRARATR